MFCIPSIYKSCSILASSILYPIPRWHAEILGHSDDLATIMTSECGKPLAESRAEVILRVPFHLLGDLIVRALNYMLTGAHVPNTHNTHTLLCTHTTYTHVHMHHTRAHTHTTQTHTICRSAQKNTRTHAQHRVPRVRRASSGWLRSADGWRETCYRAQGRIDA